MAATLIHSLCSLNEINFLTADVCQSLYQDRCLVVILLVNDPVNSFAVACRLA